MPDIQPFHGLRYDPAIAGEWGGLLGPPYDVIDPSQRAALLARSLYQITHVESTADPDSTARLLATWRNDGVLRRDPAPGYYIAQHHFRHEGRERERRSLYAVARLTPWDERDIRPHEWTIAGPKAERLGLRAAARTDISPVFGILPDRAGNVASLLEEAVRSPEAMRGVDANGEEHALRIVAETTPMAVLRTALAADPIYIADGHHRYEAALAYRDEQAIAAGADWSDEAAENFVLMGLVCADDPGLIVGATHRIVHRTALRPDILDAVCSHFAVEELGAIGASVDTLLARLATAGREGPVLGAVGLEPGRCHLLRATEATRVALPDHLPASWRELDIALLQYGLLEPILGIDATALQTGEVVTYTHDAAAAGEAVRSGAAPLAFLLNHPVLDQIFATADSGERMPQKSTYFTPKLPTGVVLYPFE